MKFLLRGTLLLLALLVLIAGPLIAATRQLSGPSLLAYSSVRSSSDSDLYLTWPGLLSPRV